MNKEQVKNHLKEIGITDETQVNRLYSQEDIGDDFLYPGIKQLQEKNGVNDKMLSNFFEAIKATRGNVFSCELLNIEGGKIDNPVAWLQFFTDCMKRLAKKKTSDNIEKIINKEVQSLKDFEGIS